MSGKGDDRRPESERGAYGRGFDAIDWDAREREIRANIERVVMDDINTIIEEQSMALCCGLGMVRMVSNANGYDIKRVRPWL